jgi:hypothetical protein
MDMFGYSDDDVLALSRTIQHGAEIQRKFINLDGRKPPNL